MKDTDSVHKKLLEEEQKLKRNKNCFRTLEWNKKENYTEHVK